MKRFLALTLAIGLLATPTVSLGAIAFTGMTDVGNVYNTNVTASVNHTASGTDRIAFAMVGSTHPITSVTYGGNAMTLLGSRTDGPNTPYIGLYYYLNPATSSQAVVLTVNNGGANGYKELQVVSYSGVNQTTPINATTTNRNGPVTSLATNLSVGANTWAVLGGWVSNQNQTISAGASSTKRGNHSPSAFTNYDFFDTGGTITGSSVTMTITEGTPGVFATLMASFNATTSTAPTSNRKVKGTGISR